MLGASCCEVVTSSLVGAVGGGEVQVISCCEVVTSSPLSGGVR
jgi:hypothetical protein